MKNYIKPIQSTPTLSGSDAKMVIQQVLARPSDEAIKTHQKILEIRKESRTK